MRFWIVKLSQSFFKLVSCSTFNLLPLLGRAFRPTPQELGLIRLCNLDVFQLISIVLRKNVAFLMQGNTLRFQGNALTMQANALTMQADALTMQANALTMQADALTMQANALTMQANALTMQANALTMQRYCQIKQILGV